MPRLIYIVLYKTHNPNYNDSFEHIVVDSREEAQEFADKHDGRAYEVYGAGATTRDFNIPTYKLEIGEEI